MPTRLVEYLWVAGGVSITLLLGAALLYWISQEARAPRGHDEPASHTPPAAPDRAPDEHGRDGAAEADP